MRLEGSCLCETVEFKFATTTPYPYQHCYCSLCRKSNGGGGSAVNIKGNYETMEIRGEDSLSHYRAQASRTEHGGDGKSGNRRVFCSNCGTQLWCYNPDYDPNFYPFASAIDSELPEPPERYHIMVRYKPDWVELPDGPNHHRVETYPGESIQEWHEKRDLIVE